MEFQISYKDKNKKNRNSIFKTLGNEKKVDYELIRNSLSTIKNDVNIFETFLSPKSKLAKKMGKRKLRLNVYVKNMGMIKNSSSYNSLNMQSNSSNSLDKLFKNRFSIVTLEDKKENPLKEIKPKKQIKNGRNLKLTTNQKKENLFITSFRMNTANDNNPINIKPNAKIYQTVKTEHLKKNLPQIKSKTTVTKEDIKSIDYVNKIISDDYKNSTSYAKTKNPMIIKKNKFLTINEDEALDMINKHKKIVNKINNFNYNFENKMVDFEAKYKYLNWKFGIADMNKYFIDIDSYKKDSEDLINNKKSFYDKLDDMVDRINKEKEMKDMDNIQKQYGININLKKDNVDYDINGKNIDEFDKLFLKGRKIKNILKELYQRKNLEKMTRFKIKTILDRSRDKINIINKNFLSFKMKSLKEMEFIEKVNKNKNKDKSKDTNKNKTKSQEKDKRKKKYK